MSERCRWIADASVPGGRYHVPGCWGTVHDPDGVCHCPTNRVSELDRIEHLERIVADMAKRIATVSALPVVQGGDK